MNTQTQGRGSLAIRLLVAAALLLLAAAYFSPTWWVALKAPQYPPEAFPSGVRINFHFNGVFNGCGLQEKTEVVEVEALDCLHEMDAINHFVGMYPIAAGGVVERGFSQFLVSMLAVMLIGFMIGAPRIRMTVMTVLFAGIFGWMYLYYYGEDGLRYQNDGYLSALVVSLGQGREEAGEELSPIIAQLKESLEKSGESSMVTAQEVDEQLERTGQTDLRAALSKLRTGSGQRSAKGLKDVLQEAKKSGIAGRDLDIQILRGAYEADQERLPADKRDPWIGSGEQVMFWHYEKSLGRWFNNPAEIGPLVKTMRIAGQVVFWGVLGGMAFLVFAGARNRGLFYWLLILVPLLLPAFFIAEYAAWLWWYGHSLNDMGAFTLKPFMPTVFGQGKVAQFTTLSYPYYGFGLLVAMSVALALAALIRRKQLKEE